MEKKVAANRKTFCINDEGHELFWALFERGLWENHTIIYYDRFLEECDCYVDLGAWTGPTLLIAATTAKRCIGVEPDPAAFPCLEKNVHLNRALSDKITLVQACIGKQTGVVSFGAYDKFGDSQSSLLWGANDGAVQVDCMTWKDFEEAYHVKSCDFLKMDIEGFEVHVLPQMREFILREKPTLFLALHPQWFEDRRQAFQTIQESIAPYKYIYGKFAERLTPRRLERYMMTKQTLDVLATDCEWPWLSRKATQLWLVWSWFRRKALISAGRFFR